MQALNTTTAPWASRRRLTLAAALAALVIAAGGLAWQARSSPGDPTAAPAPRRSVNFAFTEPLPEQSPVDATLAALGARLFHDTRLSADDTISCASCHNLGTGGVDNRARSVGIKGGVGVINAPTVFNSGLNFVQFWDGRAPSLEAQIDGPVNHPLEMGSNWDQVVEKLRTDPGYVRDFGRLFAQGIRAETIKTAIAAFERSLITPDARFDRFLRGDTQALTAQEREGYERFQSYGCASCHQGVNLGGNMFEKMGLMGDYFADRGNPTDADQGRYAITRNPDNLHEFRVPSLRNVALTAPYFHDGSAKTLEDAIIIMAKYQLGRPMPASDLDRIAAFLRSLTGQYQGKPL